MVKIVKSVHILTNLSILHMKIGEVGYLSFKVGYCSSTEQEDSVGGAFPRQFLSLGLPDFRSSKVDFYNNQKGAGILKILIWRSQNKWFLYTDSDATS